MYFPACRCSWHTRRSRLCATLSLCMLRILGRARSACRQGKSPHGVDFVAGGGAVFHFCSPGIPNSNAMSCAAGQSVDDIIGVVVVRQSCEARSGFLQKYEYVAAVASDEDGLSRPTKKCMALFVAAAADDVHKLAAYLCATRVRSRSGLRRDLHVPYLIERSSTRSAKFVKAHNLLAR